MKEKNLEEKYQILTDIQHCLARPGMYIGNVGTEEYDGFLFNETTGKMEQRTIQYNPAFLKMFDEIISNSVDESKRKGNLGLDTIKVNIDRKAGSIEVIDNGGIPVEIHPKVGIYVPEMLFGSLRSGSNFDDKEDRMTTGTHGLGAVLTNVFSKEFHVITADGKNRYIQKFYDNNHKKTEPKIVPITSHYTTITFFPDFDKLKMPNGLDDMNYDRLVKRVVDVAGCNPKIKVYLNGNLLKIKSFQDFVALYLPKDTEVFYESNEHWEVGITHSPNGDALNVAFINGTETPKGTHTWYITEQIVTRLRLYIQKKHKFDMKPGELKNHLYLFINGNVVNPKYSSQTKENLITEVKDYKTEITISEKTIKKILNSEILKSVIDWIEAKKIAEENKSLRMLNTSTNSVALKKIIKFKDCSSKEREKCILFLAEGQSAAKSFLNNKLPGIMGVFELKGKPINVHGVLMSTLIGKAGSKDKKEQGNTEFKDIMSIMGLKIGKKVNSVSELHFGRIAIGADADDDGSHIVGLLVNMFNRFWPELLEMNVIQRFVTPIVRAWNKNEKFNFYSQEEFTEWQKTHDSNRYSIRYYKGLATSKSEDFKEYLADLDKHLFPLEKIDKEDSEIIDLVFNGSRANDRKVWLDIV